ncbi:MAG: RsmB/NOP family class I SAM-dependent RNA methyltransferase [Catenisphaera adipataccumulans]|jgi:NOL1/NOP2/sun family putative RNA methylase|uniref:RsmB/NOP family class I SAM-dependent RNA methyltransferase n=1 Tax=Catenisphaera adipataccumulans TaxID=700500 RepID=UPI003D8CD8C6
MELPKSYIRQMENLLPDEYDRYFSSLQDPSYTAIRVNTLKISVEEFCRRSPFALKPVPWTADGFYVDPDARPAKHPYYAAGLYYIQEPSAMLPAQLLPVKKGDHVLDTCAAPGGKSTELACKLRGTGLLAANDISTSRCQSLLKNLESFGTRDAIICSEDTSQLKKRFPKQFDAILVDAPCSGQGMFRKEHHLIDSYRQKGPAYYAPIQKQILDDAADMLQPGGHLVYSTCTFAPEENEEVIRHVLKTHPDLKLLPIPMTEGFVGGIDMPEAVRLYPHRIQGEGHFAALLQNAGQPKSHQQTVKSGPIDAAAQEFLRRVDLPDRYFQKGDKILWMADRLPEQKGWRVLRSGLLAGTIKRGRFEPAQALALALKPEQFDQTVSFSLDDERVLRYLRGETVMADTKQNGWTLVCVENFPLGFAKAESGRLKNKLEKSRRWQ